jgi:hypothetical protein
LGGPIVTAPSRLRVPKGPLAYREWRSFYRVVHEAADKGHFATALRILRGLERVAKADIGRRQGYYHLALVHSVRATVLERAGDSRGAGHEFLLAARLAFGGYWGDVDLLTNSLWAAVERLQPARRRSQRVKEIREFDEQSAWFRKEIGDWMNQRLLEARMDPMIFGGRYPAAVPAPQEQLRLQRRRARRKK